MLPSTISSWDGWTTVVDYYYDGLNRRVKKGLATGTDVIYLYDGWQVLEEREWDTNGEGAEDDKWEPRRQYVYGGIYIDEPLIFDKDTDDDGVCDDARYFYAQQANWNVVAVTGSDATVVEKIKYDPYGEASVTVEQGQSASGNPYLFQGRRWDDEVDLYYFRNRVMSPVLGRFLQRDSTRMMLGAPESPERDAYALAEALMGPAPHLDARDRSVLFSEGARLFSDNLYMYVVSRPLSFTDPTGRDIYLQQRGLHKQVCVDVWDDCQEKVVGKQCFSFGFTHIGLPGFPKRTWLGWKSFNINSVFKGTIYQPAFVAGGTIRTHVTTRDQDNVWLNYMTITRRGLTDTYSLLRHNCRRYSKWEFRDAPLHWGP